MYLHWLWNSSFPSHTDRSAPEYQILSYCHNQMHKCLYLFQEAILQAAFLHHLKFLFSLHIRLEDPLYLELIPHLLRSQACSSHCFLYQVLYHRIPEFRIYPEDFHCLRFLHFLIHRLHCNLYSSFHSL